jgi:hypothetical protein
MPLPGAECVCVCAHGPQLKVFQSPAPYENISLQIIAATRSPPWSYNSGIRCRCMDEFTAPESTA